MDNIDDELSFDDITFGGDENNKSQTITPEPKSVPSSSSDEISRLTTSSVHSSTPTPINSPAIHLVSDKSITKNIASPSSSGVMIFTNSPSKSATTTSASSPSRNNNNNGNNSNLKNVVGTSPLMGPVYKAQHSQYIQQQQALTVAAAANNNSNNSTLLLSSSPSSGLPPRHNTTESTKSTKQSTPKQVKTRSNSKNNSSPSLSPPNNNENDSLVSSSPSIVSAMLSTSLGDHTIDSSTSSSTNSTTAEPKNQTIVLKNLPFQLKHEKLLEILVKANIKPQYVRYHHDPNGTFRGIAFVKYPSLEEAMKAVNIIASMDISGRRVRVEYKKKGSKSSTSSPAIHSTSSNSNSTKKNNNSSEDDDDNLLDDLDSNLSPSISNNQFISTSPPSNLTLPPAESSLPSSVTQISISSSISITDPSKKTTLLNSSSPSTNTTSSLLLSSSPSTNTTSSILISSSPSSNKDSSHPADDEKKKNNRHKDLDSKHRNRSSSGATKKQEKDKHHNDLGTSPSNNNHHENEKVNEHEIHETLNKFIADPTQFHLSFAPIFNTHQRKIIHKICESMGLKSSSNGQGSNKYIVVKKSSHSSSTATTASDDNDSLNNINSTSKPIQIRGRSASNGVNLNDSASPSITASSLGTTPDKSRSSLGTSPIIFRKLGALKERQVISVPIRQAKGPDGTIGFGAGRGKPLSHNN